MTGPGALAVLLGGLGERLVLNCSILLTELDLYERPMAARELGFAAIESWWPFDTPAPDGRSIDRFAQAVEDAGVRLVALNCFAGDLSRGERGILTDPSREREFEEALTSLASLAGRLGCRLWHAPYGRLNTADDPGVQHECARRRLGLLASCAAAHDATVLLEPMSGFADYPLLLAADVEAVRARLDPSVRPRIGLLADLYHLASNGEDISALSQRGSSVAHVQIADAPGRHEPGSGALPLEGWLSGLLASGYEGAVSLEYLPSGGTTDSLEWLLPALRH